MTTRDQVVEEAKSFIGTPYISRGRIKGVGVDCGTFPYLVYRRFNLVPEFEIDKLSDMWWAHTTEERYLLMVERYLRKLVSGVFYSSVPEAKPGNLLLTRVARSKVYNHAGIVIKWPTIIHAWTPKVFEVNAITNPEWNRHQIVIFDPWEKVS